VQEKTQPNPTQETPPSKKRTELVASYKTKSRIKVGLFYQAQTPRGRMAAHVQTAIQLNAQFTLVHLVSA